MGFVFKSVIILFFYVNCVILSLDVLKMADKQFKKWLMNQTTETMVVEEKGPK